MSALIRRAILIAALLVAQAVAATHVDVDDTHPAGEACAFCVGLSTLGAANAGNAMVFSAILQPQERVATAAIVSPAARAERFSIRGPPKTS